MCVCLFDSLSVINCCFPPFLDDGCCVLAGNFDDDGEGSTSKTIGLDIRATQRISGTGLGS